MTNELITDAIVEAARQADELHDPERMECLNHDGSCCPAFDHNVGDERTHRVRAALEVAAPLIAAKALWGAIAQVADDAAMDVWWEACDDEWAVPDYLPAQFLRHWLRTRAERFERGES